MTPAKIVEETRREILRAKRIGLQLEAVRCSPQVGDALRGLAPRHLLEMPVQMISFTADFKFMGVKFTVDRAVMGP